MALNMVLARHNIKKLLKQVRRQLLVIYLTYLRKVVSSNWKVGDVIHAIRSILSYRNLSHKKSPTCCRAFSYWVFRYNSCRTSRPGVALIIIVLCVGTSCSLCPHHMKNPHTDIDAMLPNSCQPWITRLLKTYPKAYPQKLGIISEL